MPILSAIGPGQLQTIQHILQDLEGEGVATLADARSRIARELAQQLSGIKRTRLQPGRRTYDGNVAESCPHCRPLVPMIMINAEDEIGIAMVLQCQKCLYSRLVDK